MIVGITLDGKTYPLLQEGDIEAGKNVFSILVGKNGSGKSTLLSSVVRGCYSEKYTGRLKIAERPSGLEPYFDPIYLTSIPSRVIAISSNPFDKFPLPSKVVELNSIYSYLGVRDIISPNTGLGFLSRIISDLLSNISKELVPWSQVSKALDFLEFRRIIKLRVSFSDHATLYTYLKEERYLIGNFFNPDNIATKRLNKRFFQTNSGGLDVQKIKTLIRILGTGKLQEYARDHRPNFSITIGNKGIDTPVLMDTGSIIFLIQSGVFKLKDVLLERNNAGRIFSLGESSSGEQGVILSILGIASNIRDKSIICIDEPETCLHPEWQEKYIQLLIEIFSPIRDCHFLIATHSPQIISKLSSTNCFIVDMETREVMNAKTYINNSIDFQLVNVFNAPGFRNEYLSRIAYGILSRVSRVKKFDEQDLGDFSILKMSLPKLDETDPLVDIIELLEEFYQDYAGY